MNWLDLLLTGQSAMLGGTGPIQGDMKPGSPGKQKDIRTNILKPIYDISRQAAASKSMNEKVMLSDKLLNEISKAQDALVNLFGMPGDIASKWTLNMSKFGSADAEGRTLDFPDINDFEKIYKEIRM
jgi:hypothetical protein